MQIGESTDRFTWFIRLATFVLIVAILHVAQDVLIPVAFAALLAFLLTPLVVQLVRWKFPKTLAILTTVVLAFSVIAGIGWIVVRQVRVLVRELPNYEQNLQRKITNLKNPRGHDNMTRMVGMVENLRRELQEEAVEKPVAAASPNATRPIPVEIRPTEPTQWQMALDLVQPFLKPLGVAGIVIVFVVAMLFQREDLRERFIKLVSGGRLNVATQAVDDAASRVMRYLMMQLVVNASYGVPIGIGLWLIGIPNAPLWGLLATLLRFIPYVGPWIAAAFPLALALAVDPGWNMLLYTAALFVVMELVSNNVIEIMLYGASTGISSLALLVAAVFWTWLWGMPGLVLSTPLTVCLLVMGNYVPGLSYFRMLLGSEPVLEPPAQFYQRMLSMESEDMFVLASKYIAEHSLEEFYDEVFVPALLMSEEDRHSGTLSEARQRFIFQSSRELIEELGRIDEIAKVKADTAGDPADAPAVASDLPSLAAVLVVPARDEADELVGQMLAHLLRQRGVPAGLHLLTTPLDDAFAAVQRGHTRAIFISALPPSAFGAARQMCRRVRLRCPGARVLIGMWQYLGALTALTEGMSSSPPDAIVTSLRSAVEELEKIYAVPVVTAPPFSGKVEQPLEAASPRES